MNIFIFSCFIIYIYWCLSFVKFIQLAYLYFLHLIKNIFIFCMIVYVFKGIPGIAYQRHNANIWNWMGQEKIIIKKIWYKKSLKYGKRLQSNKIGITLYKTKLISNIKKIPIGFEIIYVCPKNLYTNYLQIRFCLYLLKLFWEDVHLYEQTFFVLLQCTVLHLIV